MAGVRRQGFVALLLQILSGISARPTPLSFKAGRDCRASIFILINLDL